MLFCSYIARPAFSLKKVDISDNTHHNPKSHLSEVIEDELVVIDKEDSHQIYSDCPKEGSYNIIRPEVAFTHTACSCDKWNKCSSKIMELPEDDIPKSIFLYLSMEYRCFSTTDSEPVTVLLYELRPIPLPDPVSEIVSYHSTEYCKEYCRDDMELPPKSSY